MQLHEVIKNEGKWCRYEFPDGDNWVEFLIVPKTTSVEKEITRKAFKTKAGRRNRSEIESNPRAALKVLIKGCLKDWKGIYDGDNPYPFSEENAFNVLWNGPADLAAWFEEQCDDVSEVVAEGNAPQSDDSEN